MCSFFFLSRFDFFNLFKIFIWLCWVLVSARGIFSCSMGSLLSSCGKGSVVQHTGCLVVAHGLQSVQAQ